MRLTKTQRLTLYSLGECYKQLNKKFEGSPLEVFVSKIAFIEVLMKSGLVEKKERALYKNLECLEKKKLVSYKDRNLRFTQRGFNQYNGIRKETEPFFKVQSFLKDIQTDRQLQTMIKNR